MIIILQLYFCISNVKNAANEEMEITPSRRFIYITKNGLLQKEIVKCLKISFAVSQFGIQQISILYSTAR